MLITTQNCYELILQWPHKNTNGHVHGEVLIKYALREAHIKQLPDAGNYATELTHLYTWFWQLPLDCTDDCCMQQAPAPSNL